MFLFFLVYEFFCWKKNANTNRGINKLFFVNIFANIFIIFRGRDQENDTCFLHTISHVFIEKFHFIIYFASTCQAEMNITLMNGVGDRTKDVIKKGIFNLFSFYIIL